MPRRIVFACAGVIALTAVANAADIYVPGPAPVGPGGYKDCCAPLWTGFYIGGNGGYAWSDHSDGLAVPGFFTGLDPQGGFGGGQIGYNWQGGFGLGHHLVLGVEADIQGSGIEDKQTVGPITHKSNLDWFGTVRGRLGYGFGASLLYATGGFAYGHINNSITESGLTARNNNGTAEGWVVGGGWEYLFNPNWSIKAEYQFIDLGRNDPLSAGFPVAGVDLCTGGVLKCHDDAFHTVRAGINYHIGNDYVPLK